MQAFKSHALDFLKGLLAVIAVNATLAALQYISVHIPDVISYITQFGAASSTIIYSKASSN